ncbi:hypothetical protein [Sporosarcina limicola]|uniref:Uncharacterized protein n=1 Tax=Sporosarcina limicola TaxID=34101 RepID=A0A927MML3_9BACL|nr:hypothetical protein [Sporosarcina limicola]MBE1553976.1 hypothetical protein [Sporosarcina limicola]
MSVTGWVINAESFIDDDYGYVNIATTWKGKDMPSKPKENEPIEAMWSNESLYGVIGSKVGDFIETHGVNASLQEGMFTHRSIAEQLVKTFSGLKVNEIQWIENPLEHTLNNGKPRIKRAKWLPEKEVDIVYIYSDTYVDVCNPQPVNTDFSTAIRAEKDYEHNWLMCTQLAKEKLEAMKFKNIRIVESTIKG